MHSRTASHGIACGCIGSLFFAMAAAQQPAQAPAGESLPRIPQVWTTRETDAADTDSLAAVELAPGDVRVFATSKKGNRLEIYAAASGERLGQFGQFGTELGQFSRPNGIAAVRPKIDGNERALLLVVERDNHRVQVLWADGPTPLGVFGSEELKRPYGITAEVARDGTIDIWLTDTEVAPEFMIRQYKLRLDADGCQATAVPLKCASRLMLRLPESIVVDTQFRRLLACEEQSGEQQVEVYPLDGGEPTAFGRGLIQGDPEGVVLTENRARGQVVIVTDQRPQLSVWHMFDRNSFEHLASFTGEPSIANTDGICLFPKPLPNLPDGALFAVHDDSLVRAFSLRDIYRVTR